MENVNDRYRKNFRYVIMNTLNKLLYESEYNNDVLERVPAGKDEDLDQLREILLKRRKLLNTGMLCMLRDIRDVVNVDEKYKQSEEQNGVADTNTQKELAQAVSVALEEAVDIGMELKEWDQYKEQEGEILRLCAFTYSDEPAKADASDENDLQMRIVSSICETYFYIYCKKNIASQEIAASLDDFENKFFACIRDVMEEVGQCIDNPDSDSVKGLAKKIEVLLSMKLDASRFAV